MAKPPSKPQAPKSADPAPAPAPYIPPPKPKRSFMPLITGVLGIALGGAGGFGYFTQIAPEARLEKAREEAAAKRRIPPEIVKIDRMVVPLIGPDNTLSTYLTLEMVLIIESEQSEFVKTRLPLVKHAINEAMSTQDMSLPGEPRLLDFVKAKTVIARSINTALEEEAVRSVKIVTAVPL